MKITIKGKKTSGITFSDTHNITEEEYRILDYMLSWDRKMLDDVVDFARQKILEKTGGKL